MGSKYKWGVNQFQDLFFGSLLYDVNISDDNSITDIYVSITTFLEQIIDDNVIEYLDFEITNKNNYFKIIGNNSITAIWLLGIFPPNPRQVLDTNVYVFKNIKYVYNEKTRKLTYKKIKKNE